MNFPSSATAELFEPLLNERFSMRTPSGDTIEITLERVQRVADNEIHRAFSLFFSGPIVLPHRQTCALSHPKMGEFELSLGPVMHRPSKLVYEADFSVLKQPL